MGPRAANIFIGLWLAAALLAGHIVACPCGHHDEQPQAAETSCHGHHEQAGTGVEYAGSNLGERCVCSAGDVSPYIAARPFDKQFRAMENGAAGTAPLLCTHQGEVLYAGTPADTLPQADHYTLEAHTLLPSRAPPRAFFPPIRST